MREQLEKAVLLPLQLGMPSQVGIAHIQSLLEESNSLLDKVDADLEMGVKVDNPLEIKIFYST